MLKNLKLLRQERGMSQKQLADRIGVSQQSVNKYENHNVEPDIETLIRIADCFGTSVDFLIGHTEARAHAADAERELLFLFRALPEEKRRAFLTLLGIKDNKI